MQLRNKNDNIHHHPHDVSRPSFRPARLGLSEPFVPDNPHIGVSHVGGGIDPQFQTGVNLPACVGSVVSVPVMLDIEGVGMVNSRGRPLGVGGGGRLRGWSFTCLRLSETRFRSRGERPTV